ncbi:hypothetical protein [Sphingopyxis sp. H115]|nr:hypothetical protein [Sphingopyxis sp. H115]
MNSLDELLYELMSWIVFYPVTERFTCPTTGNSEQRSIRLSC